MEPTPAQKEIEAVTHFVEATRELRSSPFFIEEYRSLSISMTQGDSNEKIKGHFPDPNVLKAVLVPFRRLWMEREPCYYQKVANILKKHVQDYRPFIDSVLWDEDKSMLKRISPLSSIRFKLCDVVDVWLNTKYMHVGKT